jgi:hypothetical protein
MEAFRHLRHKPDNNRCLIKGVGAQASKPPAIAEIAPNFINSLDIFSCSLFAPQKNGSCISRLKKRAKWFKPEIRDN